MHIYVLQQYNLGVAKVHKVIFRAVNFDLSSKINMCNILFLLM